MINYWDIYLVAEMVHCEIQWCENLTTVAGISNKTRSECQPQYNTLVQPIIYTYMCKMISRYLLLDKLISSKKILEYPQNMKFNFSTCRLWFLHSWDLIFLFSLTRDGQNQNQVNHITKQKQYTKKYTVINAC